MGFESVIKNLALQFIEAWNTSNKELIMSFFSTNASFICPSARFFYPENKNNTINGIQEIDQYFSLALKNDFPELALENFASDGRNFTLDCMYTKSQRPFKAIFEIDTYGKIVCLESIYQRRKRASA